MTSKERVQIQISLDTWSNTCAYINDWIDDANQWCSKLWDFVVDIIEDFNMPHVEYLGHASPSQLCITDLE
jgi:hypothetical protein